MTKSHSAWPTIVFFLGIGLTLMILATGLPLRPDLPNGETATTALYVLNPPLLAIDALMLRIAQDLEQSWWPQLAYPVTAVVSVLWWSIVRILLVHLLRRVNNGDS